MDGGWRRAIGGGGGCAGGGASGVAALAQARWGPGKVMDRSAGFHQFFIMYAKLITGLSDSKIRVSKTIP